MDESTENTTISKLPVGLYIIAAPIGHPEDITLRALGVLKAVDAVFCEDTRVTGRLLQYHGLKKKMYVYNDFSDEKDRRFIQLKLSEGQSIALMSDAGTPLISDPGYKLVRELIKEEVRVVSLPGPSAVITALTLSGLPTDRFYFEGFLPSKTEARKKRLGLLAKETATQVFYEAARRLPEMVEELAACYAPDTEVVVARELTKTYEEIRRGTVTELAAYYKENGAPRGEVVVIVSPGALIPDVADIRAALKDAMSRLSVKDAAAEIAERFSIPRKDAYQQALVIKDEG